MLRARATKRLVALSEALAIPVVASWRRPDVFPNDHANYLGMAGLLGADHGPTAAHRCRRPARPRRASLSEIAAFCYRIPAGTSAGPTWTSSRATPAQASRRPTLAVAADASRFLDAAWSDLRGAALDAEMRDDAQPGSPPTARPTSRPAAWTPATGAVPACIPGRVVAALQALLPTTRSSPPMPATSRAGLARGYRFRRAGTFLGPTSGAMGFGLPAAIAASMLHPDRPVVALAGDGGFAMTMAELETAVREGAPVAIVFDNGHYGTIRMHQERRGPGDHRVRPGPHRLRRGGPRAGRRGFTSPMTTASSPR